MSVTGLCYICSSPTTQTCKICGRTVCSQHYVKGMCIECKNRFIKKR